MVEEAAFAGGLAVFDDDIVVDPVKTDVHLVTARNKGAFVVIGVVVDVVSRIVGVVEIEGAAVVVALGAVGVGTVADQTDMAVVVLDIVLAVFGHVEVEARIGNHDFVVFAATEVEGQTSGVFELLLGLFVHSLHIRDEDDVLELVADGLGGGDRSAADGEVGEMRGIGVVEPQAVNGDAGDVADVRAGGGFRGEKDDPGDVGWYVDGHVLDADVGPAFLGEFGTGIPLVVQFSC